MCSALLFPADLWGTCLRECDIWVDGELGSCEGEPLKRGALFRSLLLSHTVKRRGDLVFVTAHFLGGFSATQRKQSEIQYVVNIWLNISLLT